MNSTTRTIVPLLAVGALALSACNVDINFDAERGSGVAETSSFTFDEPGLTALEVSNAFEVEVRVADGPATVEVTVDDNFTDDLDVRTDDGAVLIGLDNGSYWHDVTPTAVVSVPSLELLDLSGASDAEVDGTIRTPSFTLRLSGASEATMTVDTDEMVIDAGGASRSMVDGRADDLRIDASGASSVLLGEIDAVTANVDASGASDVVIGDADDIDGDISGASILVAPADAIDQVETSGVSNIEEI
ncbi:MAG: DUF2807 domain-containing protein [Actinomycetota bacterium]